jgi:hypothetical protein
MLPAGPDGHRFVENVLTAAYYIAMKFSRNQIVGSLILLFAIVAFTLARFYLAR